MPKRNSIIIGFLVLIVIVGGTLLFTGSGFKTVPEATAPAVEPSAQTQQSPAPLPQSPPAQENIITYTDSGFSPGTITVAKGTTVIFKNKSSVDFYPASNPHPIHNGYPTTGGCAGSTFDACASIPPGGSWSFTMTSKGTWRYHDHWNAGRPGIIIVE